MRRRMLLLAGSGVFAASGVLAGRGFAASAASASGEGRQASSVVVELFTSQGCSSCPPAEALFGVLSKRADVIALAWHVDYWNNLGWHDPFASADWTQRQRRYAAYLNEEVYTPAMVVNGRRMVVGSDRAAVGAALAVADTLPVATDLRRSAAGLTARLGARPAHAIVLLIACDAGHATDVRGGENAGRTLREVRIVRSVSVLTLADGDATVHLPEPGADQAAVLLVQDRDYAILGAAQVRPASVGAP